MPLPWHQHDFTSVSWPQWGPSASTATGITLRWETIRQTVKQMNMPGGGLTNHFSFSPLVFSRTPSKTPGVFIALLLTGIIAACSILGVKMETEQNQSVFLSATFSVPGWQGCLSCIGNVYPHFQNDSTVNKDSLFSQTDLSSQSCFSRALSLLPNSALLFWKSNVHVLSPPPAFSSHVSAMQTKAELELSSDICIRYRTRLRVYKRIHFVEVHSFLGRELSIFISAEKLFQGIGWSAVDEIPSQQKQPPNKPWESWGLF